MKVLDVAGISGIDPVRFFIEINIELVLGRDGLELIKAKLIGVDVEAGGLFAKFVFDFGQF